MAEEFLPDPIQQVSIEQEMQQSKDSPVIYNPVLRGSVRLPVDAHIKGGQTAYNTGTGFFLGYDSVLGAYVFSIGDPDGNYLSFDGSALSIKGDVPFSAGDVLLFALNTERSVSNHDTVMTKVKSVEVGNSGTLRILFSLKSDSGTENVKGQIYKNGVAVGTLRTTSSGTYQNYTEDISGWSAGDDVELYITHMAVGDTVYAQNFQIKAAITYSGTSLYDQSTS